MVTAFWKWYERHYRLNVVFSSSLFLLQLFHLYWMATYIVALRLMGKSFFALPPEFSWVYALVDYTEIPALISVGLIYVNQIRRKKQVKKSWLYLLFLNIQWIHLFWITDEVVLSNFTGQAVVAIPPLLAWFAILIDFLELPVMVETSIRAVQALASGKVRFPKV